MWKRKRLKITDSTFHSNSIPKPKNKLFELYTASLIRMGFPHQSDSVHRTRDVCEEICDRKVLHFSYYCKYGVLVYGDDGTGPADESKRTKRIQEWSLQIMGGVFIICNTITL